MIRKKTQIAYLLTYMQQHIYQKKKKKKKKKTATNKQRVAKASKMYHCNMFAIVQVTSFEFC